MNKRDLQQNMSINEETNADASISDSLVNIKTPQLTAVSASSKTTSTLLLVPEVQRFSHCESSTTTIDMEGSLSTNGAVVGDLVVDPLYSQVVSNEGPAKRKYRSNRGVRTCKRCKKHKATSQQQQTCKGASTRNGGERNCQYFDENGNSKAQ